jgi:glycosyltransferase involved in cell wall biosynthesis
MVGDGDQKEEAKKIIEELKLKDKITLVPFRQDVPDILAAADIFVLPSLWEGLPIGLLEAMAMGKAIIASNVDGTSEIIVHQENGWLIETKDLVSNLAKAITKISQDEENRKRLGKNARNTVSERFNAKNMTRTIENIYLEIWGRLKGRSVNKS